MFKLRPKDLQKSHQIHLGRCSRLSNLKFPGSWRTTVLMQSFSQVTKAAIEQQKSWSTLKHLGLLARYGRGTRRVEHHVTKALNPLETKGLVQKVVKQVMVAKIADAKTEVEKATAKRSQAREKLKSICSWDSYPGSPSVIHQFYDSLQEHRERVKGTEVDKVTKKEEYLAWQRDNGVEWWKEKRGQQHCSEEHQRRGEQPPLEAGAGAHTDAAAQVRYTGTNFSVNRKAEEVAEDRPTAMDKLMAKRQLANIRLDDAFLEKRSLELVTEKENMGFKEVLSYNGVQLSKKEEKVLSLPSKFQTYGVVDTLDMKVEIARSTDKWRWSLWNKGEENGEEEEEGGGAQTEEAIAQEAESRQPWDRSRKNLDLGKIRVTQLKSCTSISRPKFTRNVKAETKMAEFRQIVLEESEEFNKKHPVKNQCLSNLTRDEREGFKLLKARTSTGKGQVIFHSDKSGKLSIDTLDGYTEDMKVHSDHKTITKEEYDNITALLNSHSSQWAEFMKVGANHEHQTRVHSAVVGRDPPPPSLYGLRKDHKPTDPGKPPPLRPVCGCNVGPGTRLGELLCLVLERVADTVTGKAEIASTEELCQKVNSLNKDMEEVDMSGKQLIVGSLDVKGLYPSLKVEKTCHIVGEMVNQSGITFEVDQDSLGRYIRLAVDQVTINKEGIDHLCPKRKVTRGTVPTISSKKYTGTKGLGPNQEELGKWEPPQVKPSTPSQVRSLMAVAVKTAIKVFMTNHAYTFEGKMKVQQEGGSIGASLTVQLSRVVMNFWDGEFKKGVALELRELNLDLRYVDDILVALICDLVQGMSQKELEELVMSKLKVVADRILAMLEFTFDHPGAQAKGWMPCLDVQLKVEDNIILYKYFKSHAPTTF